MRIALISTPFVAVPPRRYGGTELVVHELAEGLVERGHEVVLFATGDSRTSGQLRALYAEAQWPPEVLRELNHTAWAMHEVAEHGQIDVIHLHSATALACGRFVPHIPMVYTLHHERDEHLSAFYRYYEDVQYVAISENQRQREAMLPRVDVVHHGLDPARYQCASRPIGEYVCFIGRFARVKGPHTAIDAAGRAGVQIRIAGEAHPPDAPWADAELRRRLAQPHVRYLGSIGPEVKAPLLCHARALLAPLDWEEPFGLVMIEAMLSGCPVVAFARGSVPELVEDGRTGLIATSMEHMAELIRPNGPVDRIDRVACRARAIERFSRDRMVSDYLALYERARANAQHRPASTDGCSTEPTDSSEPAVGIA
ncbi:MAG: glycosyltransferase family 4 protein [Gemmatimonadaceae bacterium]